MKRQKTKKVNGLLIFSVCLLILAIATPLTLAFFTAQRGGTKTISFGKIELDAGVTTVSTTMESLVPGDKIFDEDVIVAKDIFSEDMIVRAKATYTSEDATTPITGLNGNITIQAMLNGEEFIYQTNSGLYILTYDHDSDNATDPIIGYTNAAGLVGAAGTKEYYVLADVAGTNYLGADGEAYADAAAATEAATTLLTGTLKTAKFVALTKAVDTEGNIYDQRVTLGADAASSTYTLTDTGNDVAPGDATGYRWVYNYADNYYYLAAWDGTTPTTLAAGMNSNFYNIQKPAVLRNDATYDLTGIAASGKEETLDIDSAASRTAMINYYTTNNNFVVDGEGAVTSIGSGTVSLATLKSTLDTNKASLVTAKENLATAQATYEASQKTSNDKDILDAAVEAYEDVEDAYNLAVANYNKALHLLAEVLGTAQQLFYFVSNNTVIPTELSQVTSLYGKTFTVGVTFNAIQSNYLQVGGTSYAVASTTIADMLTAFTNGNTLFGVTVTP